MTGRQTFRDATDPLIRIRIATEGMISDTAILRLAEAATGSLIAARVFGLLLTAPSADAAMEAMLNAVLDVAQGIPPPRRRC